jgi:hypothetical protein
MAVSLGSRVTLRRSSISEDTPGSETSTVSASELAARDLVQTRRRQGLVDPTSSSVFGHVKAVRVVDEHRPPARISRKRPLFR